MGMWVKRGIEQGIRMQEKQRTMKEERERMTDIQKETERAERQWEGERELQCKILHVPHKGVYDC